ncbi:hypothetical protein LEP1GSC005_1672 [Leptospira santarosai str. ST188]|uniref:Uncharacterized protein n=2 Tax=Leptospira santarosai TaxID=28183 RepID=M6V492_9LEPT|nr:hypothetical protein LEP1GSC005_1672 [Leptospira santarosai str. ST188]EMO31485.1 hypothetical protein LEP1GSC175_2305 [Leptospira santarosai str. HAI821]EMO44328.1 hypothetical protein LEP1GSC187_3914 [Leptospira santarosai str. ZUN179]
MEKQMRIGVYGDWNFVLENLYKMNFCEEILHGKYKAR